MLSHNQGELSKPLGKQTHKVLNARNIYALFLRKKIIMLSVFENLAQAATEVLWGRRDGM